jgi:hypothetical protein
VLPMPAKVINHIHAPARRNNVITVSSLLTKPGKPLPTTGPLTIMTIMMTDNDDDKNLTIPEMIPMPVMTMMLMMPRTPSSQEWINKMNHEMNKTIRLMTKTRLMRMRKSATTTLPNQS